MTPSQHAGDPTVPGTHSKPVSVLLFAVAPAALQAAALLRDQRFDVEAVTDFAACMQALHTRPFDMLLMEETVLAFDPSLAERVYGAAGLAVVLEVNFGIADAGRLSQHVRVALRRRSREEQQVAFAARVKLQSELSAALTGLLLESQLALRQAGPQWAPTLTRLIDLAEHVSSLLATPAPPSPDEVPTFLHQT